LVEILLTIKMVVFLVKNLEDYMTKVRY